MTSRTDSDSRLSVEISLLEHGRGLDLPEYATDQSAGMDVRAALGPDEVVSILPGDRTLIPTGFKIGLPAGYEAQVRPRSGLAIKHGVTVLNSPGTIDADYRGEVKVILINHGRDPFDVRRGDRIAQLVVAGHASVKWALTDDISSTERGEGGFGHTGH